MAVALLSSRCVLLGFGVWDGDEGGDVVEEECMVLCEKMDLSADRKRDKTIEYCFDDKDRFISVISS